jgi:triacylglycerol lipase
MISTKTFPEQSLLFAQLSNIAYKNPAIASKLFEELGYTSSYYETDDSNVYVVEDATDIIVVCRGTEPSEWSDISADLSINLVPSRGGVGKVHIGFRTYTDKVWPQVMQHVTALREKKYLWLTGHSLGAAMATLMARRFALNNTLPIPAALFTYGSPRVGNRTYINAFNKLVQHHRWVNAGDIVTKVPISPWYYHCGTRHHIKAPKKHVTQKSWVTKIYTTIHDIFFKKLKNDISDHSSTLYVERLSMQLANIMCD